MNMLKIILICAVAVMGIIDIKRKSISFVVLLSLLAFCIIWNMAGKDMSPLNMVVGAAPAGAMLLAVRFAGLNIGMGDVLLMAIIGVALGADTVCITMMIASVSCAAVSAALLMSKKIKKESTVAFIPFVGAGLVVNEAIRLVTV